MKKSDWYKIGAIVIVVAFVVEAFALGMMNSNGNDSGSSGAVAATELSGTASANVTVARYEPYLIVDGEKSAIDAVKSMLVEKGDATYAIASGESVIVSLKSSKSVPSAAAEFEKANATAYATAIISMPSSVRVQGDGITTTVDSGSSFTMRIRPVFEEGETVPASFVANVQGGQMVSIGNFNFLPNVITGAFVNATLSGAPLPSYQVMVPWESRSAGKAAALAQNATYKERSFIIVPLETGSEKLQEILAQGKAFVTSAQPGTGIVSVRNDFTDISAANSTLSSLGVSAAFPPSVAAIAEGGNGSAADKANGLLSLLEAANITASLVETNLLTVALPATFEWNGKQYASGGIELPLEQSGASNYTNGSEIGLVLDFEANGGRIVKITAARAG
ncbi:MAG: hypothetical protein WC588_02145 [Candidatus Micrarchaeia archaeon]